MYKNKHKIFAFAIILNLFLIVAVPAFAQVDPNFNPNKLIDDAVFSDTQTFGGPAGIQTFLESKGSPLANTSQSFLTMLKEPDITMLKQSLEDPEPNLGRLRTAAELIWDASKQSGINPQVLLVTLNKEQSLITGHQDGNTASLQRALNNALGFDCPDATGCGDVFPGFYYQLFGNYDAGGNRYLGAAKSLMKSFNVLQGRGPANANGVPAQVGETLVIQNTQGPPNNAPAEQSVTIANRATAALYRFTPHVFNGNYNFWRFFIAWFKYPNGTLLSEAGDTKLYIIQNGSKLLVPDFVAQNRGINAGTKITLSPTEFDGYPTGSVYGPADNTVVRTDDSKTYVFVNNVLHPASDLVITQRNLNPATALPITTAEAGLFTQGAVLPPNDGTIVKGTKADIYLVDAGMIKLFTPFTYKQQGLSKKLFLVPDAEIDSYQKNGSVTPLDGTLVKTQISQMVFVVDKGAKRLILPALFTNRGFKTKDINVLADSEVSAIPTGAYATPKDGTFFAVGSKSGQLYEFKEGTQHPISSYVAKQRNIKPDFVFDTSVSVEWFEGIAIPPKDSTLVKGSTDGTIYLVEKSQLRPVTGAAFKSRKYSFKKVVVLPQPEVDAYAKGDVVSK